MKKGFTLIELVAVLVILGIIALIATPLIINVIDDSKEKALINSVKLYVNQVNNKLLELKVQGSNIYNGVYSIMHDGNICLGEIIDNTCTDDVLVLDLQDKVPTSGFISINNNEINEIYNIVVDNVAFDVDQNYEFSNSLILEDSCFISTTPGELSHYLCDGGAIEIPEKLIVSEIVELIYSEQKCINYVKSGDPTASVEEAKQMCSEEAKAYISEMTKEEKLDPENLIYFLMYTNPILKVESQDEYPITKIGNGAFFWSKIQGELVIPNTIESIGEDAFAGEEGLALNSITKLTFEDGSNLKTIGEGAFAYNKISGNLIIPASVEEIGDDAFNSSDGDINNMNQITSLEFESNSNLTYIGSSSFSNNKISGDLIIPKSVETIGSYAFSNNGDYTEEPLNLSFEDGSNLTKIKSGAFKNCNIKDVLTLPSNLTTIDDYAFQYNEIETLNIGNNISKIGYCAFNQNNGSLTTINIDMTQTSFSYVDKSYSWYSGTPTINYNKE